MGSPSSFEIAKILVRVNAPGKVMFTVYLKISGDEQVTVSSLLHNVTVHSPFKVVLNYSENMSVDTDFEKLMFINGKNVHHMESLEQAKKK